MATTHDARLRKPISQSWVYAETLTREENADHLSESDDASFTEEGESEAETSEDEHQTSSSFQRRTAIWKPLTQADDDHSVFENDSGFVGQMAGSDLDEGSCPGLSENDRSQLLMPTIDELPSDQGPPAWWQRGYDFNKPKAQTASEQTQSVPDKKTTVGHVHILRTVFDGITNAFICSWRAWINLVHSPKFWYASIMVLFTSCILRSLLLVQPIATSSPSVFCNLPASAWVVPSICDSRSSNPIATLIGHAENIQNTNAKLTTLTEVMQKGNKEKKQTLRTLTESKLISKETASDVSAAIGTLENLVHDLSLFQAEFEGVLASVLRSSRWAVRVITDTEYRKHSPFNSSSHSTTPPSLYSIISRRTIDVFRTLTDRIPLLSRTFPSLEEMSYSISAPENRRILLEYIRHMETPEIRIYNLIDQSVYLRTSFIHLHEQLQENISTAVHAQKKKEKNNKKKKGQKGYASNKVDTAATKLIDEYRQTCQLSAQIGEQRLTMIEKNLDILGREIDRTRNIILGGAGNA